MASVISNYLGNAILQLYFTGATTYIGLHTSDPGVLGSSLTEVVGGDYIRKAATWSTPGSKTIGETTHLDFDNMPACTVTHFSVWTAISGGNMLVSVELSAPVVVADSARFTVPPNDMALTL